MHIPIDLRFIHIRQNRSVLIKLHVQCFSFQRFVHFNFHCGYTSRCVKYASPHLDNDCSKTKEADPKCTNCDGVHTANSSKCPALIREKILRHPTSQIPYLKPSFPLQLSFHRTSNSNFRCSKTQHQTFICVCRSY